MFQQFRTATLLLFVMTFLTGVVYPAVVTLIAQVAFSFEANGSILVEGDTAIGSELIGQSFSTPEYFWGRLSATSDRPFNAAASSGSNLGPRNPALNATAIQRITALHKHGTTDLAVPVDLVTASASGLDPHISPAAAAYQVPRVAASRKLAESVVLDLVHQHTEERQLGILGEPRVNVLRLNLALNRLQQER